MSASGFLPPRGGPKSKQSTASLQPPASPPSQGRPFSPSSHSSLSPAASTFRDLVFRGSISIQISIQSNELPPNADRSVDTFFIQAPRISYLPLLLAQVRKFLEIVLDPSTAASVRDEDLWFDHAGAPLKWHWPIGVLYDFHTAHAGLSHVSPGTPSLSSPNFFTAPSLRTTASFSSSVSEKTVCAIANTTARYHHATRPGVVPWRLTLHLKDPPMEALLMDGGVEACRTGFMNMLKEADYVRFGSVKRVTNLRKEQQDALWDGVVQNDFEKFWTVASKLVPLPSTQSPSSRAPTPSSGSSSDNRVPTANEMRSVPMRIYLPEGAPVLQDVVPPTQDGQPTTLLSCLSALAPLFFPKSQPPLARPLVHGVQLPLDTEIGWLGACLPGADGWVAVVLVLQSS